MSKIVQPASSAVCPSCTVPVDHPGEMCTFCSTYAQPEATSAYLGRLFDNAANLVQLATADLEEALKCLPDSTGIVTVLDVSCVIRYLRAVAKLVDRAADSITTEEVTQ